MDSESSVYSNCFKQTLVQSFSTDSVNSRRETIIINTTTGEKRFRQYYNRTTSDGNNYIDVASAYFNAKPACVAANPCANPSKNAKAIHVDATSLSAQVDYCLNGCLLRVAKDAYNVHLPGSVADRRTAWGTWVGQQCSVGPTQPEQALEKKNVDGTDGACLADGKSCISREKKNCGYVSGEYRCITSTQLTPENPCVQTPSGAVFCRADATTPPKPDNGTPGQPATPDTKFDLKDPTLFGSPSGDVVGVHYFKPSTVKGDSNDTGGQADGDGRCEEGEKGSADCNHPETGGECEEGEECGEDSAGGDGCAEEPSCSGDPVQCYLVIKQWETMCALAVPANEQADEAITAAAGEELSEPGSLIPEYDPDGGEPGINVLEQLQGVINDAGSSASCIADLPLSLNIGGRAANSVVPLSQMCDLFKVVGLFVMLSAAMRSAWIIMRGYGG